MNNYIVTDRTIKVVFTLTFFIIVIGYIWGNIAYSDQSTPQERYDSGVADANSYCNANQNVIDTYMSSDQYFGHTEYYHQGFITTIANCISNTINQEGLQIENQNTDNQEIPLYQNTAHFNSDNTRSDTNTVHSNSDNDNKLTTTTQGQMNRPLIFCVIAQGSCPTSNIQGQSSGN